MNFLTRVFNCILARPDSKNVALLRGGWCDNTYLFFIKLGLFEATNLTEWEVEKCELTPEGESLVYLPWRFSIKATAICGLSVSACGPQLSELTTIQKYRTYEFEFVASQLARREIFDSVVKAVPTAKTTEFEKVK